MAGILYDNRTLTFGENGDLTITEKQLADTISEDFDLAIEDAVGLVKDLIDALDYRNENE